MNSQNNFVPRILVFAVIFFAAVIAAATFYGVGAADQPEFSVSRDAAGYRIEADGFGVIRQTQNAVSNVERLSVGDPNSTVFIWNEQGSAEKPSTFYSISLDGKTVSPAAEARYKVLLRYAEFDPLESVPNVPQNLASRNDGGDDVYIVQFKTQTIDGYIDALESFGAKVYKYLPDYSYIVRMDAATREKALSLPFVRWIGKYEPAYKIEPDIIATLSPGTKKPNRYNIMMLDRGAAMQNDAGSVIESIGGKVENIIPEGFRMEATLDDDQLIAAAQIKDVLFIDRWSAPENDMNIVRQIGGANFIESTLGFRGEGVRAEVMDNELRSTHTDFNSGLSPLLHTWISSDDNHGTSTYGINFGRGTSNSTARGMLPEAQGIFADYNAVSNRYTHTAQLNQAPYYAVYQSNSWGSDRVYDYTTISAEMDDILFLNDILITQSQSNAGSQHSRPQAWAKNIVSVGGIVHWNNTNFNDDRWNHGASTGPATDGRIKPELASFYDSVYTTNNASNTSYYQFGGTSAATPIVAGHFGIFFQMWHAGLFGNPTGATVFDSRPHMTTSKAIMINTAKQWDMNIPGTDITRVRQGFGHPDLQNLYALRNKMLIVDEADVLTNLQTKSYVVYVTQGSTDPLKVTMIYADPMGSPSASRARINDLSLKVTDPDGNVFWGNNGLGVGGGMWSASGGSANIVDTVENVFILSPTVGAWTIEVIASEINEDARRETPGVRDADFALVASGITRVSPTAGEVSISGRILTGEGTPISAAVIRVTDDEGITKTARTGTFGFYSVDGLRAGRSYIISAAHPRYQFFPASIVRTVNDNITDVDFVYDEGIYGRERRR
jgi:hypothetical protein